jgi:hypothetical protein
MNNNRYKNKIISKIEIVETKNNQKIKREVVNKWIILIINNNRIFRINK